jgi:hypothetical protein
MSQVVIEHNPNLPSTHYAPTVVISSRQVGQATYPIGEPTELPQAHREVIEKLTYTFYDKDGREITGQVYQIREWTA